MTAAITRTRRGAAVGGLTASDKRRIAFVDIGRALSALAVFYSHVVSQRVNPYGYEPLYMRLSGGLTSLPMHMGKQGIGEIAVPFFFLVSGFIVTPIAIRHGIARFAVNRVCRLYPPMIFVVLATVLVMIIGGPAPSTGQSQLLTPVSVLLNISTFNYLVYPQVVLVPVAWTMIIEVLFYLVLIVMLPVFRRSVWLAITIELAFVLAVLFTRSDLTASYSLFAVNVSYLPIPITGQIVWACWNRKIPLQLGGLFLVTAWVEYVLGDVLDVGRVDNAYSLAMACAVLLFLIGVFAEPHLRERPFWVALSERSYSLYLLHMLVAYALLDLLQPRVPYTLAMLAAVVGTFLAVEISYRLVEKPSHRLGRLLSRSRPVASVAAG